VAFDCGSDGVAVPNVAFYYAQLRLVENLNHVANVEMTRNERIAK